MLEHTHKWIANQVAGYLNLNTRDTALLAEGSVIPDREQTFPHHSGKENEILRLIKLSRTLFLDDDDRYLYTLGMLLHYNQDGWTQKPRISDKHTEWEKNIDDLIKYILKAKKVESQMQAGGNEAKLNLQLEMSEGTKFRILDIISYLEAESGRYGSKFHKCIQINEHFFKEDIHIIPLPSKDIELFLKMFNTYTNILNIILLSFHKEKNLLEKYPQIFEYEISKYKGALGGTFSLCTGGAGYRRYPEYSHPYIDLFFSLITSIAVACQILYPLDISPPNWSTKYFKRA